MSLADLAKTPPMLRKPGMPCPLRNLLDTLPTAEADGLAIILASPAAWPHTEVEKALEAEGHYVAAGSVGKHRRLTCKCRFDA